MNRQECDCLLTLLEESSLNQRKISELCGHSLGVVNRSIKKLKNDGFLNEFSQPTAEAMEQIKKNSPKHAIILAAGFCMRMVPVNIDTPKAFLEVNGEPLIERLIKQLHEVAIFDIHIVVGFMKERFEYLIDAYGVKLVVNQDFAKKNNLYSLYLVSQNLNNSYIIPCDVWCKDNPFRRSELYSWYMVSDFLTEESDVRINRSQELVCVPNTSLGNAMIGIAYLVGEQAYTVAERISNLCRNHKFDNAFWETALYEKNIVCIPGRLVSAESVVEINTYEQLRELDNTSIQLRSHVIHTIENALHISAEDIQNITVLKKGMTNRSFVFSCQEKKYIMRIPGEGTSRLIDRRQEAEVYRAIDGYGVSDDIIYIDPENGYKITAYLPSARTCDHTCIEDVTACMKKLREFHELGLKVEHTFDIWQQIQFYESLWEGKKSVYKDYLKTKQEVFSLKAYTEANAAPYTLTHIDAIPDNFLFVKEHNGEERIRLIDWEYAGMQDPHVDIAMFCIYSSYNQKQIEQVISAYFLEGCDEAKKIKIYCYISACGLLWSNWCEYKRSLGVEFGAYSITQYRYAKEYYRLAYKLIGEMNTTKGNQI